MPDTAFDYIIVGAGSAGCVLANRLTEDGQRTVLLLEAGGSDRSLFIRMPAALFNYGHTNAIDEANWRTIAWCIDAYLNQFEGVLPWQSIAGQRAMSEPTQTALIVDGGDYGPALASLRLHALREGAQLVELLRLLQSSRRWSRGQTHAVVDQILQPRPGPRRERSPRSPLASSRSLTAADFVQLKLAILQLLEETSPPR